jgi:hypothetical protein
MSRHRPTVEIKIPREISASSWLNEPRFEWFKKGYEYASSQTLAIPTLAVVAPEELYHATMAILRSMGIDPEA